MTVPVVPDNANHPSVISNHSAHPKHKLKRVAGEGREFTCNGCKRPGSGASARYRCEHKRCDFVLHTFCAVAPDTLTHPAFPDREFLFLQKPEPPRASTGGRGGGGGRSCGACGKPVRGFVYHCFAEDLDVDLHPFCARQQEVHAVVHVNNRRVSAPVGKEAAASRQLEASNDKDNRGRGIRLRPFARHRWDGRQAVKRDPTPENTQLNNGAFDVRRQEMSRPGDTSGERNREREGPPVARHRSSKR